MQPNAVILVFLTTSILDTVILLHDVSKMKQRIFFNTMPKQLSFSDRIVIEVNKVPVAYRVGLLCLYADMLAHIANLRFGYECCAAMGGHPAPAKSVQQQGDDK